MLKIGDAEAQDQSKVFCTKAVAVGDQGTLPEAKDFWIDGPYIKQGQGKASYIQITGCINPEATGVLVSDDDGGQYDALGGTDKRGVPKNSRMAGCELLSGLVTAAGDKVH